MIKSFGNCDFTFNDDSHFYSPKIVFLYTDQSSPHRHEQDQGDFKSADEE